MATPTYTALANITLSGTQNIVTFSALPSTYRHFVLAINALGSTTLEARLRLNSDTGANYIYQRASTSGTVESSQRATGQTQAFLSSVAKATSTGSLQLLVEILECNQTKRKVLIARGNQAQNGSDTIWNIHNLTAAVTSIEIITSTGNWAAGSTFTIYGLV
jgi:hypothetical protein